MFYEREMSEGDMLAYVRALEHIEALKNVARRQPHKAKALRHVLKAHTNTARDIAARYEV